MSEPRFRIATWNVNSIRAREAAVLEWLQERRPEVLCMQETKVSDEQFPAEPFRKLGYEVATHGQKGYNGVAIVTTEPLQDVARGFGGPEDDEEGARLLAATVRGVRIHSAYVPNGKVVGSPAYESKLRWLAGLRSLLESRYTAADRIAVCGDFNIAADERDVHDPWFWKTQVLFHPTGREALRCFCDFGLADTFRLHHEEGGKYSWWDYRQGAFQKDWGLRIDYVFVSRGLAPLCDAAWIDRAPRGKPSPSDHAPVVSSFRI
jgi:exodeoxyribonuclease-3